MGDCPQGLQSTIHESRSTARELSGPRPLCRDPIAASPPEHTVWRSLAGLSPQLALTPRYTRHSRPILPCEDLARDHKCNRPLLQLGTVSPSCTLPDFLTKCECVIVVHLHFTPEGSVCSRIFSRTAPGCSPINRLVAPLDDLYAYPYPWGQSLNVLQGQVFGGFVGGFGVEIHG